MRFIDSVKIHVRSGNGGPGCTSFRRAKFEPFGGPDGGDGGKGGAVILRGDTNRNTLIELSFQQHQYAENGVQGSGQNRHGKDGEDCIIKVPLGTVIKDLESEEILLEVLEAKDYLFLEGGRGGRGNTFFKSSTNQAPRHHQPGEPGQEFWVRLELKLMADVGLVGFPNAGKSTLISSISRATPKIADYPFTTLVPNLGVVKRPEYDSFVVADIPGLIEGAHEGIGLGDRFLKHIERTSILVILLDVSGFALHSPLEEYEILLRELQLFSEALLAKPRVVVFNKLDAVNDSESLNEWQQSLEQRGEKVFRISAVARQGLEPLLVYLTEAVRLNRKARQAHVTGSAHATAQATAEEPEPSPKSLELIEVPGHEQRQEPRYVYCYRLSVTHERSFGRGQIVDWSRGGLQVISSVKVEAEAPYRVRLHVERDRGLLYPKELSSVEGDVRWVKAEEEGWKIGIRWDQPLERMELTQEDFCYIFFMPAQSSPS